MDNRIKIPFATLDLPAQLCELIGRADVYESSGQSGARTVYVNSGGGFYIKIAERGTLAAAARMQAFFAERKLAPAVIDYFNADRDYLLTAPLTGEDGTTERYLREPKRLSALFGSALRSLHETDPSACPVTDCMRPLLSAAENASFFQQHLDDIRLYIGPARAEEAAEEIKQTHAILKNDTLIHGDYCLPNIMLHDWVFSGFIDVADGGVGDRHYDLAWGLWTLNWNLRAPVYGHIFLDAYGREHIDPARLRVCGLLAAMA